MFARLGRWCHDHWIAVLALWLGGLFLGNVILAAAGGTQTNADFSLPDVESSRGVDILEDSFGGQGAGFGGTIVFFAEDDVNDPAVRETMEAVFADIGEIDGIARVGSPYDEGGERQIATEGEFANRIAFAQVDLDPDLGTADVATLATDAREVVDDIDQEGLQVELGGATFAEFEPPSSELLGVAFAIVILILAFGSVLAMGLPIGVALAGIGAGTTVAGFLSFIVNPPDFASIFGLMIGLGVGIDYALFIVTRFRENLHRGQDVRSAVATAIDTAGRAVIFAGTTVVISMLGMIIMRLSFVTGMAVAIATVVAATMLASVTLLPALLGLAKHRIEVTRWGGLVAAALMAVGLVGAGLGVAAVAAIGFGLAGLLVLYLVVAWALDKWVIAGSLTLPGRQIVDRQPPKPLRETTAYRWSRVIQRYPWPAVFLGTVMLLVLAIPLLGLRLGFSDEGNYPTDTTTRQAYDLLGDGFGVGYNGPLMLVSELPEGEDPQAFEQVAAAVGADAGVQSVSPPQVSESGDAVFFEVIPTTSPQDEATTDLVDRLREEVLPPATAGTGLDVAVSGTVPIQVDFAGYLAERLVYFLAAVLVLSFLLLMVVFRSLLVPLKAVIMNLLSIGAAYGVMVAGFQWGWLGGILDFEAAPIEAWMPMMLFAIVFGLSMDYEVFLLSRVKEEWLRTGDSRTSVADGLAATARVITAAALIMVFVFGAFLLEPDRVVKLMGVGLATAVLLDATVVRMLLVPATMELLGDRNWWLPRWLDRILPNIDVEGHDYDEDVPDAPPSDERVLERV